MRRTIHGAIAVGLAAALVGCAPEREVETPIGGGGGPAAQTRTAPQTTGPDVARARIHLGEAYISAARVHRALVESNYNVAQSNVNDVRRQLRLASQYATLQDQRQINQLEARAIELQSQINRQTPAAVGQAGQLVQGFFNMYDRFATGGAQGGGAGVAPEVQNQPQGGGGGLGAPPEEPVYDQPETYDEPAPVID